MLLSLALLAGSGQIEAREDDTPRVHKVYRGQRLGLIAKRYQVSVEAICTANGIRRRDPIQPGQLLIIPARDDPDGTRARRIRQRRLEEQPRRDSPAASAKKRKSKPRTGKAAGNPNQAAGQLTHTVQRGQRLGLIAKRYDVSIEAICKANGISRHDPIQPGQVLVIPGHRAAKRSTKAAPRGDRTTGRRASAKSRKKKRRPRQPAWKRFSKAPWRKGYVTLIGYDEQWKGYVIGPGNKVLSGARRAISRVLVATDQRPRVHRRLVRLIAKVSDQFGGRPIRVVSGYRERSHSATSRHRKSRAIDFSIPGVPNSVLYDYLRTLSGVGVGYYPSSTFVHLDVREKTTYWVDRAGPGEFPRYAEP